MNFRQFFPIPVIIAILAATLVMLDGVLGTNLKIPYLWTWISFQAWAMYFLAGCSVKGGVKVMLGYLGGALASIAIMELLGLLAGPLGAPAALAIAVFIVVVPVISAERLPWLDFIPSWFVGAGVFFGVMNINAWPDGAAKWGKYGFTLGHLMVSCLVGQVYGWVTVFLRTKYEASLKLPQPAAAEDAPAADA